MAVDGAMCHALCRATKFIGSRMARVIRSPHFFGRKVRFPTSFLWRQKSDQFTVMYKLNCAQITVLRLGEKSRSNKLWYFSVGAVRYHTIGKVPYWERKHTVPYHLIGTIYQRNLNLRGGHTVQLVSYLLSTIVE